MCSCISRQVFYFPYQLTCMILGVLRFDSTGPPYFRFNDDGSLVWPQGARITDVRLNSTLDAYNNHSLELTGQNNQQVYITYLSWQELMLSLSC